MKEKLLRTPDGILLNQNYLNIRKIGEKNRERFYRKYVQTGEVAEKEVEKLSLNEEDSDLA